ncbi:MAG: hypothetical protein U0271_39945 [Polyangiaceae bacterium]
MTRRGLFFLGCLIVAACLTVAACGEPPPTAQPVPTVAITTTPGSSAPATDWAAELEWARSRFPELKTFRPSIDMQPILSLIPEGRIVQLFLTVVDDRTPYRCAPVEASRHDSETIELTIPETERTENGVEVRSYRGASFSATGFYWGGVSGLQKQTPNGDWETVETRGSSGQEWSVCPGPIEGDALRFRVREVEFDATCGPIVPLACESGGSRGCNLCKEVKIAVRWLSFHKGRRPRIEPPLPSSCSLPCPAADNPDLDRIERLRQHFESGYLEGDAPQRVALYRTLAGCEADASATKWASVSR